MRLFRPGPLSRILYPDAIFRVKSPEKVLYLTFDDGPDPHSTALILSILEKYGIRAIFFCSGNAAEKHPGLMNLIRSGSHLTGNHGYDHNDGWRTPFRRYIADIKKSSTLTSPELLRPPYGHITFLQYITLKEEYKLVFWDIMPYDFDSSFGARQSLSILKKLSRPGSIIILHDNHLSSAITFLEEFILYAYETGFRFGEPEKIYVR